MNERLHNAYLFMLDRLGEPSTWQGIGFLAGLIGMKWGANLDWGAAAAFGGTLSALIKATFPDSLK